MLNAMDRVWRGITKPESVTLLAWALFLLEQRFSLSLPEWVPVNLAGSILFWIAMAITFAWAGFRWYDLVHRTGWPWASWNWIKDQYRGLSFSQELVPTKSGTPGLNTKEDTVKWHCEIKFLRQLKDVEVRARLYRNGSRNFDPTPFWCPWAELRYPTIPKAGVKQSKRFPLFLRSTRLSKLEVIGREQSKSEIDFSIEPPRAVRIDIFVHHANAAPRREYQFYVAPDSDVTELPLIIDDMPKDTLNDPFECFSVDHE